MRRALVAVAAALAVACGGDEVTGSSTVNGAYTLRTVNGAPLPYTTAQTATSRTEIVDDVITLFQGGTYTQTRHTRTTVNGQVTNDTRSESGSYVLGGTSITFTIGGGGGSKLATGNGNTITIVEMGLTAVYSK